MNVLVVSGSRADMAALRPVAEALKAEIITVATAPSVTKLDSALSTSEACREAAEIFIHAKPDMIVIAGDRYEILGAAIAAHLMDIPIAHLSGGDITEGSQDDSMRHAITKLAHLHFPTNEDSANRILVMGEEHWRVHMVGDPGIDTLLDTVLLGHKATLDALKVDGPYYLVAYQPATLSPNPIGEAEELVKAFRALEYPCIFTTLNTDAGASQIDVLFRDFCKSGPHKILEMDSKLFLSAMKHCRVMIGNSSSGLYEAPSLQKAFVNVGGRQKGRLIPRSVINAAPFAGAILVALKQAEELDCSKVKNPYGDGNAAQRIRTIITTLPIDKHRLLTKKFVIS